jgi:transposase-like protein
MICPFCERRAHKNGTRQGEQQYWCDFCKYGFTENSRPSLKTLKKKIDP